MKRFLATICFFLCTSLNFSKDIDFKYGEISREELEMKICPIDSSAGAVVIYDACNIWFDIVKAPRQSYNRKLRIKIFDKKSYHLANKMFFIIMDGSVGFYLTKKRAHTVNVENGNVIDEEVIKDDIIIDKVVNGLYLLKIPFENVKEGSIIEMEITMESPIVNQVPTWYFQSLIPIMNSKFTIEIPDFLKYRQNLTGNFKIDAPTSELGSVFLPNNKRAVSNIMTWTAKSVPAITEEPYIDCLSNYFTKLDFELSSISFPGQMEYLISTNWQQIIKRINSANVNETIDINSPVFLNDFVKEINSYNITDRTELMKKIYYGIKARMMFNERYDMSKINDAKIAYRKGEGNSTEINLILYRCLKIMNFDVQLLAQRTRSEGLVPYFPTNSAFNNLLVRLKLDDKLYVLDATNRAYPYNLLPIELLNDRALLLDESKIEWVDLLPGGTESTVRVIDATINSSGLIEGKFNVQKKEYAAAKFRTIINDSLDVEKFVKELEAKNDIIIKKSKIYNLDSVERPIIENYDFQKQIQVMKLPDSMFFFNLFLLDNKTENPLNLSHRSLPVNFSCPLEETYIVSIALPKGYIVEKVPKSIVVSLPDNSGKLSYKINVNNSNIIQVNCKFFISKFFYGVDDYSYLRELYSQYISKMNETIIVKKI